MSKRYLICLAAGLLAVFCAGLLWSAPRAWGHANMVRSEPPANSVLDRSPGRVKIWFTEPLEPDFSRISVLNVQGEAIDNGDSAVDADDPMAMTVTLPQLAPGTYTVAWRNLSTVDGHTVRGSFIFSVGEAIAQPSPPEQGNGQEILQSPLEPVLRWIVLLGLLTVFGGIGFDLLVSRPVLQGRNSSQLMRRLGQQVTSRIFKLVWLSTVIVLGASVAQLIVQTSLVFDVPLPDAAGKRALSVLLDTQWGGLWMWRIGLLLPLLIMVPLRGGGTVRTAATFQQYGRIVGLCLSGVVLLTLTLGSHGAATAGLRGAAIFTDFVHLLAAGFWVGGLFHLALELPLVLKMDSTTQRKEVLAALIPRFSVIAALSVGTLIITGLYSGWAQVTILEALATPYGYTLLAKVALVLVLLVVGAVNLLWIKPRLSRHDRAGVWLHRLVLIEVVLAGLVLLSVGFLTSMEPARQVASRQGLGQERKLMFQDTVEGANIRLEVEPGTVGANQLTVALEDMSGNPIANADNVLVSLLYLDTDLGGSSYGAVPSGQGKYVLEKVLSLAGAWQVEVVVRRPDAFDARTAFRFEVDEAGDQGSGEIAPASDTGLILLAFQMYLLAVLFLAVGLFIGGWWTRRGAAVMGIGLASFLAAIALTFSTGLVGAEDTSSSQNPFPPTADSLEAGQRVYAENCQSCHGASGRGDGPKAAGLNPPPANLVVHVPLHFEDALFGFIVNGVPGSAMAPLRDRLTDEEIWHVINYIETFEAEESQ